MLSPQPVGEVHEVYYVITDICLFRNVHFFSQSLCPLLPQLSTPLVLGPHLHLDLHLNSDVGLEEGEY